ncbi:Lrp/AsnC family transcriptional regulator [Streptomyces sp. NPDC050485]|uniref:Lrp/AsnC family transcriptional regulator n=1 Tax=Streptomyces sp. NPDC050485 TaxID=3365617 RepID=UPI0037963059
MDSDTLDALDRQLVHALQIDGRAPFSRIATALGASDRTVARRYHRLRSAGALRVVGLPNARRLGMVDWFVRIQCTPDAALAVAATLSGREDTSWVGLASGGTEITCITRAPGGSHHDSLLLPKLPRTSRITAVTAQCLLRAVAGTAGWHGRTAALSAQQAEDLRRPEQPSGDSSAAPASRDETRPVELSEADRRLLPVLAKDGRADVPSLATATGWSESTVRRRMEELRHDGVLYFDVEIDPVLFGFSCEAVLWLTVASAELSRVAGMLSGHSEIAFAAATTGPSNMVAFVVCRDADALYDYLATRIGALSGVLRVETTLVTRHVKRAGTLLPPLAR